MSRGSDVCKILDCPDEILLMIFSYVNARERVALSKICERFDNLIFHGKKFFRDLDFSEEGFLTSMSDVKRYFEDKTKLKHIYKINLNKAYCLKPQGVLAYINTATNLAEVNINGFKFQNFKELGLFLEPLKHLRKLSSDWPAAQPWDSSWHRYLHKPFRRLTHLSLIVSEELDLITLFPALQLCLKLKELYLVQTFHFSKPRKGCYWLKVPEAINKLRKVTCCGYNTQLFKSVLISMLPNRQQWTKMYSEKWGNSSAHTDIKYIYFEKNLEVSEEFNDDVRLSFESLNRKGMIGWYLRHENLLSEVLRIKQGTTYHDLCFFHVNVFKCSMTMKDTKLLLLNPGHQISYLNLTHNIKPECDIDLISLTFPKLTKLVLSNLVAYEGLTVTETDPYTGVNRRLTDSGEGRESPPSPSSFKILIDNTPYLQDLTFYASSLQDKETWDLPSLYLIAGWKNLKTLHLSNVPIIDGRFLIEIGKQCTNIEKLRLENLGPRHACCYKKELLQMLGHCHNLKDFSIRQDNIGKVSDLFNTLAGNSKLRRVCVESLGNERSTEKLLVPIKTLVCSCNLILLICEIKGMSVFACNKLKASLKRLKNELNRPFFEFEVLSWNGTKAPVRNFRLHFAHRDLTLSHRFNDTLYCLGCL